MVRIILGLVACAAFCLGSAAAWAQPPGHAKHDYAKAEQKSDKGLLERVVDEVLGRQGDEQQVRERQNPNSNAQWLPDAKRGQARAAERRPAHAGPKHARDEDGGSFLDQLLGEDERIDRAKSKRKRERKLGKIRKQKRQKTDAPNDLVGVLVEQSKPRKAKN